MNLPAPQGNRIKISATPLRFPRQPEMVLFQFSAAILSSLNRIHGGFLKHSTIASCIVLISAIHGTTMLQRPQTETTQFQAQAL